MGRKGHTRTRADTVFMPARDPARIQISGRLGAMAPRGRVAYQSSEGRRNLARSSFVAFVGCGIIRSTGFQPCKGGDMACIRGPLGACVAIYHNVGDGEGLLRVFEAVPLFLS